MVGKQRSQDCARRSHRECSIYDHHERNRMCTQHLAADSVDMGCRQSTGYVLSCSVRTLGEIARQIHSPLVIITHMREETRLEGMSEGVEDCGMRSRRSVSLVDEASKVWRSQL